MNEVSKFLLSWLIWWAVLFGAYTAVLFALDALLAAWQQYQRVRRQRQALAAELARIDRQADNAVHGIGIAFTLAQILVREEARSSRAGRS
jgi:uncharacterized SAM-binding protein YcdF (DUF218 family)